MITGTKVSGIVNVTGLNRRSLPSASAGVVASSLSKNVEFTGEITVNTNGENWVKLATVAGLPVVGGQYIAGWLCSLTAIDVPTPSAPKLVDMSCEAGIEDGAFVARISQPNSDVPVVIYLNGQKIK